MTHQGVEMAREDEGAISREGDAARTRIGRVKAHGAQRGPRVQIEDTDS